MFSAADRDRARDRILQLAASDARVVAGAVVGSLALDEGDRWSDLDLTFAVADHASLPEVLEDWTRRLADELDAAHLFDLPSGPSIYRVFLLPGCLQFDLSFTPASQFGASGPKFRLLFGQAVDKPHAAPPSAHELFGYAVHHALRARFCIERGRYWHAEYWISGLRDSALSLACRRRGLPARYGRGFDDLPVDVRDAFHAALVCSLDRPELLRALGHAIARLLDEAEEVKALAAKVEGDLRSLVVPWNPRELWEKRLWEDQPDQWVAAGFSAFWYLGYHTLFWLDLYLTGAEEGFAPPAPFDLVEMNAGEVLPRTYTREELLRYLEHCRRKCKETVGGLSKDQGHRVCRFAWGELPFAELQLYNLRHVQEHGAQLPMFLGQQARKSTQWVAQAQ